MVTVLKQGNKETTYRTEYLIDTTVELAELPTFPNTARGSTCLCLEDKKVYILNNANTWVEV